MQLDVFSPVHANEFIPAFDSFDSVVAGRLFHRRFPQGEPFGNLVDMALLIEDVLDMNESGQMEALASVLPAMAPASERSGELATFRLEVMFRQHDSWQGKITWVERNQEASFRSFLELVLMLKDILAGKTAQI